MAVDKTIEDWLLDAAVDWWPSTREIAEKCVDAADAAGAADLSAQTMLAMRHEPT